MKKQQDTVLQFKVTLDQSVPRVWRRILLPNDATFFDLHVALQDAMGWQDGHLHAFSLVQEGTTDPIRIEFPDPEREELYGSKDERDERVEKIADYFGVSVKQCQYKYDFGDNWKHTVVLEKELPAVAGVKYPQCIAGKNACPPEDCGGAWGYRRMIDIIRDKQHPEHQDMMDWMEINEISSYDPTEFVKDEVIFRNAKTALRRYEKMFGVVPLAPKGSRKRAGRSPEQGH